MLTWVLGDEAGVLTLFGVGAAQRAYDEALQHFLTDCAGLGQGAEGQQLHCLSVLAAPTRAPRTQCVLHLRA